MNTLSDTDERPAKPSVWPVYVAIVVVLIAGLASIALGWVSHRLLSIAEESGESWPGAFLRNIWLAQATLGLLGVVAAIGMLRLRGWGWWCGSLFAGAWIVGSLVPLLGSTLRVFSRETVPAPHIDVIVFEAACIVVAVLLLGVLATRRQLFFPPKQAGEDLLN